MQNTEVVTREEGLMDEMHNIYPIFNANVNKCLYINWCCVDIWNRRLVKHKS